MTYAELLSEYIRQSKLSLREISRLCAQKGVNVDYSYISKLRTGANVPPSEEITRALAEVCGGDPERLIYLGHKAKAPREIQKILEQVEQQKLYALSETGPSSVICEPRAECYPPLAEKMIPIPVVADFRDGMPGHIAGYRWVPAAEARNGEYFFWRVPDNHLAESRICAGDLLYVRRQKTVASGDIAVINLNGQATLKKIYRETGPSDGYRVIGKVIRVIFDVNGRKEN